VRAVAALIRHKGHVAVHGTGSGKTLTAVLAAACFLKSRDARVVLVAPTSLVANFWKELPKYCGDGGVGAPCTAALAARISAGSYQGFAEAADPARLCRGALLILDEAHNRRNATGAITRAVLAGAAAAAWALVLTATPLVNRVADLAPLLAIAAAPTRLAPWAAALTRGVLADEASEEAAAQFEAAIGARAELARAAPLFSFYEPSAATRRAHYPILHTHDVFLVMSPGYERDYAAVEAAELRRLRVERRRRVRGVLGSGDVTAFYNGVRRASNTVGGASPKLSWLLALLAAHPAARVVVFSNFRRAGAGLVAAALRARRVPVATVGGDTPAARRAEAVRAFNAGALRVLVVTRAGSEGLDLRRVRFVVLLDPGWNEAQVAQVVGRGVRYDSHKGVSNPRVDAYRLFLVRAAEAPAARRLARELALRAPDGRPLSVDLYLRNLSKTKQLAIDAFLKRLRAAARRAAREEAEKRGVRRRA
jgi:superfamily II DNA or RNA helicase